MVMDTLEGATVTDIERRVVESRGALSPEVKQLIVDETFKTIEGRLNKEAVQALRENQTKSIESYLKLAQVQREYALAINTIRLLDPEEAHHDRLKTILFDTGKPTSLASQIDRARLPDASAEVFMLGPISALTLYDIAASARHGDLPSMDDVLARPELDAFRGLDFIQYAGAGRDGGLYVNLVQIKTNPDGVLDIVEIEGGQGEYGDYLDVNAKSAHKLKDLADTLNAREEAEGGNRVFRAFVVLLPAYDSRRMRGNLYGKITDQSLLSEFREVNAKVDYMATGGRNE